MQFIYLMNLNLKNILHFPTKSWLQTYEANIIYITRKLIENIQEESAKTLKKIQELEIEFNKLIIDQVASKKFYEMLLEIKFENDNYIVSSTENIRKSISELFTFYDLQQFSWSECNEAIFSGAPYLMKMKLGFNDCVGFKYCNPKNCIHDPYRICIERSVFPPARRGLNKISELNKNSELSILYKHYRDRGFKFSTDSELSEMLSNKCYPISDSIVSGLVSIDLNTLQLSILDEAPNVGPFCQLCKIDKNTYLMQGCNYTYLTDTPICGNSAMPLLWNGRQPNCYLMNIKTKTFKIVTNGPNKVRAASVLKNNKV